MNNFQEWNERNSDEDEEIEINYDLPEGIYIADESLDQRVKLTVTQKKDDEDE